MTKLTQEYLEKGAEVLKERGYSVPTIDEKKIVSAVQELGDKLGYVTGRDKIQHIIDLLHSRFCDVPDTPRQTSGIHVLDYGTPIGTWSQGNLTVGFILTGYAGSLPAGPINVPNTIAWIVKNVFDQYQAAQPFFSFTYLPAGQAGNITIAFDTTGAVPANGGSTQPPQSGAITLSATIKNGSFLPVLLHEAGHALGLSHSTNPASVMYPFTSGATLLDPETIEAIQSLYGWKPQTQLPDRASTHGPSIAVVNLPSFTSSNETAFMAWKGAEGDSTLWWASSADGISWSPQQHLPDRGSSEGPCLATYHPRSADGYPRQGLFMAWKGVGDDHNIYWSINPDLDSWSGQQSIPVGTSARPALIEFNGQMVLAWKGVPGDSGIYWSKFDGVGTWSPQQQIAGRGTSDGPVLAVFGGQLHMFWKGIEGDDTVWHAVLNDPGNGIWGPQQQVTFTSTGNLSSGETPIAIGTSTSLSATVRGSELVLLWKGVPGDHAIWYSRFNGNTFSGQMSIPNVGTESYPAIGTLNGKLIAGWRGINDDRVLYVSSLG